MTEQWPDIYEVSPGEAGNTSLLWTCECGTHRVNFAWIKCPKCGIKSPARETRDAGGEIK